MARAVFVASVLAGCLTALSAQEARQTFRSGVDVIQLDVSVLDKARRPVVGLTAGDFIVLENGKPQEIVSVEEADAAERDPLPSAWMRYTALDVAANDLGDQLGDGRLAAIVIDDRNLPAGDVPIAMATRSVAHYLIDQLGPSDRMAIVYAQRAGFTQDFTADHARLGWAVDRFDYLGDPIVETLPGRTDLAGEWRVRAGFARPPCLRSQPTVPTLDTVVSRLATVPGRRKTLFFISVGVPVRFGSLDPCQHDLAKEMTTVFEKAKRGNVNIHAIDPTGYRGFERYLRERAPAWGRMSGMGRDWTMPVDPQTQFDFLRITAESTGGRVLVDADPIEPDLDRIFEEDRSYYLVGYVTANPNPDGKFHQVEVRTRRRGLTVRTRSGYMAASKDGILAEQPDAAPSSQSLALSGLTSGEGLPLRLNVLPLAADPASADGTKTDEVALILSVRLPAVRTDTEETLTVIRHLYDADGQAGPPVQETTTIPLHASFGEAVRYDYAMRVRMPAGHRQVRVNASSSVLGKSGTVFADVDVPDFARSDLELSAVALGHVPDDDHAPLPAVAGLLPIVPTTEREFSPAEKVSAFMRVFQAGAAEPGAVTIDARIYDAADRTKFSASTTLAPAAFSAGDSADYRLDLPLDALPRGPYLLSLSARAPGGDPIRRDLLFRIR
jgi:VWFA-related protein